VVRYHLRHGEGAPNQARVEVQNSQNGKRVVCLNVPDRYEFMEPDLVRLFTERVPKFMGSAGAI
jgi:predicted protein tyrosine phosphatase